MDYWLSQLPNQSPPSDLPQRILEAVQKERQRALQRRLILGAVLALSGVWFTLPTLSHWVQQIAIPSLDVTVLLVWTESIFTDLEGALLATANGMLTLQTGVAASLTMSAWLGMLALAAAALLWMHCLLTGVRR
jgi:hypothetical protein